jgi:purine-cytosine permease-like protein
MATHDTKTNTDTSDFALTPVPANARMPLPRVVNVTLGIAGAMVFMQLSGQMALEYGAPNAILASVYATLATGCLATVFAYVAINTGLNSNLLARGTGYGFVGAALTSLVYASQFIVLAAIEGSIIAEAVYAYIPALPIAAAMLIITLINIALNWGGMSQLDWFQRYSLPLYLVLLGVALALASSMPAAQSGNWYTSMPVGGTVGGLGLLTCMGILNGIVGVQSVLTADYARFVPRKQLTIGALAVGILPQVASFFIMGLVGIWFAVRLEQPNPGIYMVVIMGVWGAIYTALSQLRINVINIYSGSLSLSNFFARVFGFAPARVFWVVVAAALALVAMLSGVLEHIGPVLTFQGVFMFAWAASMAADLLVVRRLNGFPDSIEYRQAHLRSWNPVGPAALLSGSLVGGYLALAGPTPALVATSAFIAGLIAFGIHVTLAIATHGRYYVAADAGESTLEVDE